MKLKDMNHKKLTQSEARLMLNQNKIFIAHLEQDLSFAKIRESDLYHLSDKDNPETVEYFVELNAQKEYVRFLKKRLSELKCIQRKMKYLMSMGS